MKTYLEDFNNHLMDGFSFCKKVYALFEYIRRCPGGEERLRLRRNKLEKKLIEELLPIARYIQARYSHGRQIKVRWIDGIQSYDACLLSAGALIDKHLAPKKQFIEVTTAVHENDHVLRRLINDHSPTFSVKGIETVPKNKGYQSTPYVYTNYEAQEDLSTKILERIQVKNEIEYPKGTILIIQCFLDTFFLEDEWDYAFQMVKKSGIVHRFYEIFIFDSNHHYSATLFGDRTEPSFDQEIAL